ncbi:MAG TPA: biotin/lipoyl-binding protein [Acidimicrobiales bacterium]|nr:biotin/lipoyl-binding protein [Acidimicrobiales bacterium]
MGVAGNLSLSDEGELILDPRSLWMRHKILIVAVVVVVLGAGTGLTLWLTRSTPATGLVITTQVVSATTGTMQQTVAATGTIEPATQANLSFAVAGTVTAVDVKAGQTVAVGQVLATVDAKALAAQVNAAAAQLSAANARLASDQAAGAATTQIYSDEAGVTSAESSLTSAQTSLGDASLTSTIAGTVASVGLTVGQQLGGTGSGGSGQGAAAAANGAGSTAQVVVIGTTSYIVNTTVDDTQIGQIAAGDQAVVTPTGAIAPDYGTVASIGLIATQTSGVATFPVVVDITGDPAGLYAGSTASVSLIVKQLNNVTEVPSAAISYAQSGQASVTQVVHGKDISRPVTVGDSQAGLTQIVTGIAAGDRVLERVVTFKGIPGGGGAGLFGGNGTRGFGGGFPGGGFPGGGSVTFNRGGGG